MQTAAAELIPNEAHATANVSLLPTATLICPKKTVILVKLGIYKIPDMKLFTAKVK